MEIDRTLYRGNLKIGACDRLSDGKMIAAKKILNEQRTVRALSVSFQSSGLIPA